LTFVQLRIASMDHRAALRSMLVLNNTHPFSIARAFWLVRTHTLDVRDAPTEHSRV
jgi:hypothetical protein